MGQTEISCTDRKLPGSLPELRLTEALAAPIHIPSPTIAPSISLRNAAPDSATKLLGNNCRGSINCKSNCGPDLRDFSKHNAGLGKSLVLSRKWYGS
jgi:hypothetical protein